MKAVIKDATILKKTFDLLVNYALEDLLMQFTDGGIRIKTMDASRSCMVDIVITPDLLNELDGKGVVFFSVSDYKKSLSKVLGGKTVIEVDDNFVKFKVRKTTHNIRRVDGGEVLKHNPNVKLSFVELKTSDFVDSFESVKEYSHSIEFSLSEHGLSMRCGDEKFSYGECFIPSNEFISSKITSKDIVKSSFSPDFIDDHLPIIKMSTSMRLGIGQDLPILMYPKIKGVKSTIFIAPRIENE